MDFTSYCFGMATGLVLAGLALFIFVESGRLRDVKRSSVLEQAKLAAERECKEYSVCATVDKMTHRKTSELLEKLGSKVTGFILTTAHGERVLVELGAVRFASNKEFWDIMHPSQSWPFASAAAHSPSLPPMQWQVDNLQEQLNDFLEDRKEDPTEGWYQQNFDFTKIRSVRDTIEDLKELVDLTVWQQDTVNRAAIWLSGLAEVNDSWWQEFIRLVDLLTEKPDNDHAREGVIELVSRVVATPVDAH